MSEKCSGMWFYKKGWKDCANLLKDLANSAEYDSWDSMIAELNERFDKEELK